MARTSSLFFYCRKRIFLVLIIFASSLIMFYHSAYVKRHFENAVSANNRQEKLETKFVRFYQDQIRIPEFRWCEKDGPPNPYINCQSLFEGDIDEIEIAKHWKSPCSHTDSEMYKITRNCTVLKQKFEFYANIKEKIRTVNNSYSDSNNGDYSLAFVIMAAKNAEQTVRLFQSIYSEKNLYCVTYDNKSHRYFKGTLRNLDKCYDNVFMPKKFVDVYWSGFSILQTAMNCLKVLYKKKKHKWKYVQIVSWNDYPLRTNEEMVKIMRILNGSQDSALERHEAARSRFYFHVNKTSTNMEKHLEKGKENWLKPVPPGNLIEYKGSLATTMSREFVQFLFENSIAVKLYEWSNTTYMAEEMYFSTLIHNLHINPPGGFPGACESAYREIVNDLKPYISRYQIWYYSGSCEGKWTSFSCVYGVGDLRSLFDRPELMAHKLYLEFQPATYYCLAELHYNRTMYPDSYSNLDLEFYENLPSVEYQRLSDKSTFQC